MPRIPDQLLRAVAFVFPNADSAHTGKSAGGTAFFVRRQLGLAEEQSCYLVTNTHVAQASPRTIRFLDTTGATRHFDVPATGWCSHPNGDDVSVTQVPREIAATAASLDWAALAVTPARMVELNMGVGDEIFMLGRFLSREAVQLTQPLARFGSIAMMPGEFVRDGRGLEVEAFLVEMRSLSGFSGSPVFVYMGPGTYRGNGTMMPFYSETIGLVGVDTGHKATTSPVECRTVADDTGLFVALNSGVSIVAPVWRIAETIDHLHQMQPARSDAAK